MKKILPIVCRRSLLKLFLSTLLLIYLFSGYSSVYAQTSLIPSTPAAVFASFAAKLIASPSPTIVPAKEPVKEVLAATDQVPPDDVWVKDPDVTFVGKVGARSGQFLDWTLKHYEWAFMSDSGQANPLVEVWKTIALIVGAFIAVFVLVTAFVLIVTRGRNLTLKKFIPRFVFIVLLITLSYALIQFTFQITDGVQGFFLKNPECVANPTTCTPNISQKNLLNIGYSYEGFEGYRKYGAQNDESAFISLLLIKLTAVTYYAMSGILLLRKIILWFFIIVSPIFPLLLFYSPLRNTAKIWMGEFFRWLLYAPLFAVFLSGLVSIWRSTSNIPLDFNTTVTNAVVYPTAISILLGGPQQTLSLTNSVNNQNTFALYVVALIMLWVVIILPFLLLQIFLDYLQTLSLRDNSFVKQLVNSGSFGVFRSPPPPSQTPSPSISPSPASTGLARSIPISAKINIPEIRATDLSREFAQLRSVQSSEILRLTNLSVPTMRDIAKYESSALTRDISKHTELAKMHEKLESISNPLKVATPAERQYYQSIKEKLTQEKDKGNPLATSILSAVNTTSGQVTTQALSTEQESTKLVEMLQKLENPMAIASPLERQKFSTIKEQLATAAQGGDPVAASLVNAVGKGKAGVDEDLKQRLKEAKEKGSSLASEVLHEAGITTIKQAGSGSFPVVNRVQSVNLDDYEAVKKMWVENYQSLEPPQHRERKEWVSSDIEKITQTINFLTSTDSQNVSKGMEAVGTILPFLLIGGFSQTEVIAYLKAKLEAAKSVLSVDSAKEEEEETMLDASKRKEEKPKEMTTEEAKPLYEETGKNEQKNKDQDSKPLT